MAKSLRLSTLSAEERDIFLKSIGINPAVIGEDLNNPILKEFESSGIVPEQITNEKIRKKLSGLPKDKVALLNKILEDTKDESNLTDEELLTRLQAFQESPESQPIGDINERKLKDYLGQFIHGRADLFGGLSITRKNALIGSAAKSIIEGGNFDIERTIKNAGGGTLAEFLGLANLSTAIKPLLDKNEFRNPVFKDVEAESRIQNILNTRNIKRGQEQEIETFLNKLPSELESSREEFFDEEQNLALENLRGSIPEIEQELNARGLLFSGGVEDVLSSRALDIQSSLELARSNAEFEDNQFYYDAAYRNALRKNLESSQDFKTAFNIEKEKILTERENKFNIRKADIERDLEEQNLKSDFQRQSLINRSRLERERRDAERKRRSQIISGIGAGAGAIIGAKVGGVPGAIAGQQIGSELGNI